MIKKLVNGLVKNWFLMVPCVGLIAAGLIIGLVGGGEDAADKSSTVSDANKASNPQRIDEQIAKPFRVVTKKEERARAAIDRYTKENEELGSGETEEKNLYRIGNLYYSMIFDYEKATLAYIQLIDKYPETDKLRMAYVALADCYNKMGDYDQEMETYKVVTQQFPADSPAHILAADKLKAVQQFDSQQQPDSEQQIDE